MLPFPTDYINKTIISYNKNYMKEVINKLSGYTNLQLCEMIDNCNLTKL